MITLRDKNGIQDVSAEICKIITQGNTSLLMARYLCMQVINCIMKASMTIKFQENIEWHKYDWFNVVKILNKNEFADIITEICSELCRKIPQQSTNQIDLKHLYSYIHTNVYDQNFSVGKMAGYYGISDSSLSHLFKQLTQKNITDYINELRIQKAKEILINTNIPIKKIVTEIGYFDVSSFIRKFKQQTGFTPGEYRKKGRNPDSN